MSRRIFELVIFDNLDDLALTNVIVLALDIMKKKIINMHQDSRFHYIGHGVFLEEVFSDKRLFQLLFSMLKYDCDQQVKEADEQSSNGDERNSRSIFNQTMTNSAIGDRLPQFGN